MLAGGKGEAAGCDTEHCCVRLVGGGEERGGCYDDGFHVRLGKGIVIHVKSSLENSREERSGWWKSGPRRLSSSQQGWWMR